MKKIIFAAALSALAAGRAAASPLDEGALLMAQHKYPEAVSRLEREARANPGSPKILLNLGWAYWHAKRLDEAARVASTLVKLDPENRTFLIFQANTDIERKKYGEAATLAGRALKRAPEDHDASVVLARALFLQGKRDEAVALLDGVLARSPGDPVATYRKATFRAEMGHKREALALLDSLLRADPENASYRRGRAKILADLGRQQEAVHEWKDLSRQQTDTQSLMNLGWTYWRQKDYAAAWEIASTLVKIDDTNPVFLRFMANLEIERMNYREALRLAQKALSYAPGDRDAQLTLSKALFRMQREKEATAVLQKLLQDDPDNPAVQARWAELLSRTGHFDEALSYFNRLIAADPLNQGYRLNRAAALYEKGNFDAAVAEWKALASGRNPNMDAVRRLRDDAFNRRDWDGAVAWQKKVIADKPSDPAGWEKLSKIYTAMKQPAKALRAAESAISADPVSINAYYMKSEILEQMEVWPGAKAAYEDVIGRNRNSIRALDGLSYVQEAQGDYDGAKKSLKRIEALIAPSVSPYLEIHRARLLADSGRFAQAHALLRRLEADRGPMIPVLLYHGLSRFGRSDAIPQSVFWSQMQALKEKGYRAVTVSELGKAFRGEARLPEKPILITFDDARTDSFENADPVLREMGFRATMFVHVSKLRKPHFHASPEDIARWQATGRWEMQAHGYEAHDPMPLDAFGRKGHFLANRMWLASADRLETVAEYRARVAGEYQKAKQGVEDIVPGQKVVAFAYPYGDYGQNDYSNSEEAASVNQALVRKNFRMAFVQEQYGMNTLASNPTDLRRYEVPRYMTPEKLLAHLTLSDPRVQAKILEAQLWIRADQLGRAEAVYAELKAAGVDEPRIWADEGVAFEKGGDITYARNLFSRAAEREAGDDGADGELARKLVGQAELAAAPRVAAEAQRFTDSNTNSITKGILRGSGVVKSARLEGWVGYGEYSDRLNPAANLARVRSREGGVQLRWFADPRLEVDGLYARRAFWDGATGFSDNYALAASYQLIPALRVAVRDGQGNVETAAAIRDSIKSHTDGAGVAWDPALNWKASADYDRSRYNDSNLEQDVRLRLTKRFSERVALGVAYFNGESKGRAPDYYTPRGLNQYTGVLTLSQTIGEANPRTGLAPADALLQYEGGYGFQSSGSSEVNSVKAALTVRPFDRVALSLGGQYAQSPLYISRSVDGTLTVAF